MTLGSHQSSVGKSQAHITPRWIIERLGPFDLDPCAADPRPWNCAARNIVEAEDGLSQPWRGRVWLNPPFDQYAVAAWMRKLASHGDGIALLHARTEAAWFEPCWEAARGILFLADRIKFCRHDGSEQPANSGAPPVLVAFGPGALEQIERSGISGALVTSWSWRSGDYDAEGDFAKSLEEGYRAIRERVAAGGPGCLLKLRRCGERIAVFSWRNSKPLRKDRVPVCRCDDRGAP